jgi:hypothetical protein
LQSSQWRGRSRSSGEGWGKMGEGKRNCGNWVVDFGSCSQVGTVPSTEYPPRWIGSWGRWIQITYGFSGNTFPRLNLTMPNLIPVWWRWYEGRTAYRTAVSCYYGWNRLYQPPVDLKCFLFSTRVFRFSSE